MALKDRITDDMKTAMRAKDSARLGAIRLLLAAIKQKEVDERATLDDAGVIAVVDKLLKQRRDSIAAYEQAGRTDLADKERAEAQVLEAYLPARLDATAIAAAVQAIVGRVAADLGRSPTPADMGKIMALAKAELAGQADMGQVSAAVKAALAG
ncbi:MAG: GatB/YqeY domain-containing protein [Tepidimonas sp.]